MYNTYMTTWAYTVLTNDARVEKGKIELGAKADRTDVENQINRMYTSGGFITGEILKIERIG